MQKRFKNISTTIQNDEIADTYYYARIFSKLQIYDVLEIKVRAIYDDYFVGLDTRDKIAYLFNFSDIDKTVFEDRDKALQKVLLCEERDVLNEE